MPIIFNPAAKIGTKKAAASYALTLIDGYTYKEVHKAVGKRQDQQKYARQHLRALEFIRVFPYAGSEVESRIFQFYKKNKWDETDVKKVCYHTNYIISGIWKTTSFKINTIPDYSNSITCQLRF
jgi:hypothetical protein